MNSENKPTATLDDHGRSEALAHLRCIQDLVLKHRNATTPAERLDALADMWSTCLSLEVRGGWHLPEDNEDTLTEYRILLSTGGPAVRLIGTLGPLGDIPYSPDSVRLEYQDWFTQWMEYPLTPQEREDLLFYARAFEY